MITEILSFGAVVYYLVKILLFEHKESHYGPLADDSKQVKHIQRYTDDFGQDGVDVYVAPVTLFDHIRFWLGNAYIIEKNTEGQEIWFVKERAIEKWTCPTCLSMWVAFAVFAWVYLSEGKPGKAVIVALGSAGVSAFLHEREGAAVQILPEIIVDGDDV